MAINELQALLQHLQEIESQEEELMVAAQDRESQVREQASLPAPIQSKKSSGSHKNVSNGPHPNPGTIVIQNLCNGYGVPLFTSNYFVLCHIALDHC